MATLLSIIQDACKELGLPSPSAVAASTDETVITLLAMANREGRAIARDHDWTVLTKPATITTIASTAEYALEDDYSRLLRQTEWDNTGLRPMVGPVNEQEWRALKVSAVGSGVVGRRFRIARGSTGITRKVWIDPTPTSVDTLTYQYTSKYWCANAAGTPKEGWTVDTDVPIVDPDGDLHRLGIQVRFRRSKGLDFASEADEYLDLFKTLVAQDRPSPVLNMAPSPGAALLSLNNVPETGYGS